MCASRYVIVWLGPVSNKYMGLRVIDEAEIRKGRIEFLGICISHI